MDIESVLSKNHAKALIYAKKLLTKEQYEHTLRVTEIIFEKKLDPAAIDAAILHDILYLKKISYDELREEFGEETCGLVKEIALIEDLLIKNYSKIDNQTLSSLILSASNDLRTIIIQLAEVIDLLKNNLGHDNDIKKIAKLSENVYYPISVKLGLSDFSWKLQDYSFKISDNQSYEKVKKLINRDIKEREKKIEEFIKELDETLSKKFKVKIYGRPKNFRSIHNKLKKVSIKKMYDIYGIRIICNKERECYEILGIIHSKYDFIKEAFDDYIAKEGKGSGKGGYQSLHTAIKKGEDIFEIQIRTWQMHMRTESSIYWEYKRLKKDKNFEEELSWERQLIEWQKSIGEKSNKRKIANRKILAFTPKREVIALPRGATVLDFAFAIHTEVGKKAKGAIINGFIVPLLTKVQNLDNIEIITDQKYTIKENWLTMVKTEKSKQKIRTHFNIKPVKKKITETPQKDIKKIKLAECCHPLPGEDVIGVKTTKRKIIIHKTDCENIKNIDKKKIIEIGFEKSSGKTKIYLRAIDRIGLLSEILTTLKNKGVILRNTNFSIKKSGYVDAIFEVEVKSAQKIDQIIDILSDIPSVESVNRE